MQQEEMRRAAHAKAVGDTSYVPSMAVSPELLDLLNQDAQNLAQIHVRRQEVAQRLEQVDPAFADLGPVAREEYLNEWLKDADANGDPNAASMIYTGSLNDEMQALGIRQRNVMETAIEKRTSESWTDAATRIATDPEGFAEEVSQFGGATTTYDRPLEDLLANPAMKSQPMEDGTTSMGFSTDWIKEGLDAIDEFPIGSPERNAAGKWWVRQTDRSLQAMADAKQDEIDQFVADRQTGESGNIPAQNSPIGKKKTISDAAELLLDQDLAEMMQRAGDNIGAQGLQWIGGMIDRMMSEPTGSIQELATEILGSEQAFAAFQVAFEEKHGFALELTAQDIYDTLAQHGWSAEDLDQGREREEAYVMSLQAEKNQVLDKRNEVVEVWGNVSDITNIAVVQEGIQELQAIGALEQ